VTFVDDEPEQQQQNRATGEQPDTYPHDGADGEPGLMLTWTSGAQHGRRKRYTHTHTHTPQHT